MFAKILQVSALLACLSNAQCSAEDKDKNYKEANKMFANINAAQGYSGDKPMAPLVESEDQFIIDQFRFHHKDQKSWHDDCKRKYGKPVVGSPIQAVIKICGG